MNSNCCNAPIIENTDLCSLCFEHCSPIDDIEEALDVHGKDVYYNGVKIKDGKDERVSRNSK